MANGVAVIPPLAPERPSVPALDPTNHEIGAAMADASAALGQGLLEYWDGGLCPQTRMLAGERIARLYQLQQSANGIDFDAIALKHGRQQLRAQHGAHLPEGMLDLLLTEVLAILARVTAFERALAH